MGSGATTIRRLIFGGLLSVCTVCFVPADAQGHGECAQSRQITRATLRYLAMLGENAAVRRVWVYFTDKQIADAADLGERLAAAADALDPHAAARRRKTLGPGLVDYRDLPVSAEYCRAVAAQGATIVRESRWLNAVSVRGPLETLRAVAELPCVAWLVPVARGRYLRPPDSAGGEEITPPAAGCAPSVAHGRAIFDYGPSYEQMEEIGVVAAHDAGWSGAGVRICMMDTGYWREHPVFTSLLSDGRLIAQWDFVNEDGETQDEPGDPEGQHNHGTTTWSLVGGFEESELVGVAFGAEFLLAKTEDTGDEYPAEEDNWVAAMEWADTQGADILSTSLNYIQWYTYEDMDGNTAPITIAADIAAGRGMVACVAAGNWGTMDWYYIGAPADGDSVIAVGGTMPDGTLWYDSSHGPTYDGRIKPEVCARGSFCYSAVVPGGHGGPDLYRYLDGTSVACPLVAGAAALLLETHPDWPAMLVREALMMTADNADYPDNDRGWGRIDVLAALGYGADVPAPPPVDMAGMRLLAWPSPAREGVSFRLIGGPGGARSGRLDLIAADGSCRLSLQVPEVSHPVRLRAGRASGTDLPGGVYLARLSFGQVTACKRFVLLP